MSWKPSVSLTHIHYCDTLTWPIYIVLVQPFFTIRLPISPHVRTLGLSNQRAEEIWRTCWKFAFLCFPFRLSFRIDGTIKTWRKQGKTKKRWQLEFSQISIIDNRGWHISLTFEDWRGASFWAWSRIRTFVLVHTCKIILEKKYLSPRWNILKHFKREACSLKKSLALRPQGNLYMVYIACCEENEKTKFQKLW